MTAPLQRLLHRFRIHPRRFLNNCIGYSKYIGFIHETLIADSAREFEARRKSLRRAWTPQLLKAPVGKTIAVIAPHPDDESIGPGGLLLAHRGLASVYIICLTNGERGGALEGQGLDPKSAESSLAETRRKEVLGAAQKLGAVRVEFCGFPDSQMTASEESVTKLRALLSAISPDVVLVPWFLDDHPDHRQANLLFVAACEGWSGLVLGYEIWTMLEPNALIDISDLIDEKVAIISTYHTQIRTVEYASYVKSLARVRAFHFPVRAKRTGAVEAYVCLPFSEYRDLTLSLTADRQQNT